MSNNKQIEKPLELPHQETIVGTNTIQTKPFDNQKTMSNNKQSSSVEWLAVRLKEKMQVWNSTKNYQEFHIVLEAGEFAKLIEKAKAMHKSEIIWAHGIKMKGVNNHKCVSGEQYYNETFNQ